MSDTGGRRRRRPAVSCSLCRKRKIKCNREFPCNHCERSKNASCIYEKHPALQSSGSQFTHDQTIDLGPFQEFQQIQPSIPIAPASTLIGEPTAPLYSSTIPPRSSRPLEPDVPASATKTSTQDFEAMQIRIRELERQLSEVILKSNQPPVQASSSDSKKETTSSCIAKDFYVQHETPLFDQNQAISRSVMHKTRLFGQSHWINGIILFQDILHMVQPHLLGETTKTGVKKCKYLSRIIKSQRAPSWPSMPSTDLPAKDVADKLIDCYLRTTETIYRILHIPTFLKDYEALWISTTKPDMAFIVQLKLVFAIGAAIYDDKFSLRSSAIRWVYEAQTWISEPEFKLRLSIQGLQNEILLLLARETAGVGGNLIWISVGSVLRTAVYMGLHREPTRLPRKSVFSAEMRRRLWNTILEISLQSSMHSGGPPLIVLEDYDTEPPNNFDDDQLMSENPVPKPPDEFTQSSTVIAFRKTLPLRLAIVKLLNDLGPQGTYEEALRLDTELRTVYKALSRTLHGFTSNNHNGRSPAKFETCVLDFFMSRWLLAIHVPFFGPVVFEKTYAYSRKVVIETALKIWCAIYPSSSIMAVQPRNDRAPVETDDLARLAMCGIGFFRTAAIQAAFLITAELKNQLQGEESLGFGSIPLRPDLLSVLDDSVAWSLKCIEVGETNVKGYLFGSIIAANIKGLMRGVKKEDFPELLVKASEDAENRCLPILERMAAEGTEGIVDVTAQTVLDTPPGLTENWDFMMSDSQFNFLTTDPMSWMFNDETMHEPTLWG